MKNKKVVIDKNLEKYLIMKISVILKSDLTLIELLHHNMPHILFNTHKTGCVKFSQQNRWKLLIKIIQNKSTIIEKINK